MRLQKRWMRFTAIALIGFIIPSAGQTPEPTPQEIQIGQPKVWRYDRMFPMLDGLLRDVEGVSLNSLTNLDPSEVNSRVIDLLQQFVSVGVNVDRTAGIANAVALDSFNATRNSQISQLKDQGAVAQSLADQKAAISKALADALSRQTKDINNLAPGTTCDTDKTCAADKQQVKDLNDQLTSVQATMTSLGVSPASLSPPSLTGVAGPTPSPTLSSGIDPKSFIQSAMQMDPKTVGSLPARERLENFITLLNDRLTKQLALSLDERALQDNYVAEIMEFDVAVEPKASRKDQKAVSLFTLETKDCDDNNPNNKKAIAYNLYPSLAAFNVASINGRSAGFLANGGFKGLLFGSNIGFQRQRDRVNESLQQSVYISGFREKYDQFGWYYGPPAYVSTVRPGIYTTFAVVLVPKKKPKENETETKLCTVNVKAQSFWQSCSGKLKAASHPDDYDFPDVVPATLSDAPMVKEVQYWPHYGTKDVLQNDVNVIAVEFKQPTNPNLLITASGKLLKRVRDWRGRATSPGPGDTFSINDSTGAARQVSRARGLFEADIDEADTWVAVSQTKILIKLAYATAQTKDFPEIRLLVPGSKDWDLRQVVDYTTYDSKIKIGNREYYACHPKVNEYEKKINEKINEGCMPQPSSLWLPMFSEVPENSHILTIFQTHGPEVHAPDHAEDAPDNSGNGEQHYIFLSLDDGKIALTPNAQVTVFSPAHSRFAHPIALECAALETGLLCHLHPSTVVFSSPSSQTGEHCLVPSGETIMLRANGDGNKDTCNWKNYRLQVQVMQPGWEDRPAILATADYPAATGKKLPIFGAAISAERIPPFVHTQTANSGSQDKDNSSAGTRKNSKTQSQKDKPPASTKESWRFQFPVHYSGQEREETEVKVCSQGNAIEGATAILRKDNLGDARRDSMLILTASSLKALLSHKVRIYGGSCDDETGFLGELHGIKEFLVPSGVELTRTGETLSFYHFTGHNLDHITQLVLPNTHVQFDDFDGGIIANLNSAPPGESLLYYAIGDFQAPVSACWDQPKPSPTPTNGNNAKDKGKPAAKTDGSASTSTSSSTTTTSTTTTISSTTSTTGAATTLQPSGSAQTDHVCGEVLISKAAPKSKAQGKAATAGHVGLGVLSNKKAGPSHAKSGMVSQTPVP